MGKNGAPKNISFYFYRKLFIEPTGNLVLYPNSACSIFRTNLPGPRARIFPINAHQQTPAAKVLMQV